MLAALLKGLANIIYPKVCLVCRNKLKSTSGAGEIVCLECRAKIKINLPPFCHSCGRHLEKTHINKQPCPACVKRPLHFDRAFSPYAYEGVIKELIHEFKYKGKDYLGHQLSKMMIAFIKEYSIAIAFMDLVIPIPLHKGRLREREFNQAQILSNHIAKEFNKAVASDALKRIRYTKTQTELGLGQRLLNVKESFAVNQEINLKGKNILLVDDVLTTGATCSEAAHTLKHAGSGMVFVLTLAN